MTNVVLKGRHSFSRRADALFCIDAVATTSNRSFSVSDSSMEEIEIHLAMNHNTTQEDNGDKLRRSLLKHFPLVKCLLNL